MLDESGSVLLEQRLSTTPKALREVFGSMPRSRIALETGMHSPWVSRLLSEPGHETIVAHARNMRLTGESRGEGRPPGCTDAGRWTRIDPELLSPGNIAARKRSGLERDPGTSGAGASADSVDYTARGVTKSNGERLRWTDLR